MQTIEAVRALLTSTLHLGARGAGLRAGSGLLGELPELDSMAVMQLVAALEARFGIDFEDEDISADTFATLASLAAFVTSKQGA